MVEDHGTPFRVLKKKKAMFVASNARECNAGLSAFGSSQTRKACNEIGEKAVEFTWGRQDAALYARRRVTYTGILAKCIRFEP